MKKILGLILFIIAFAFGADVRPFVFENIDTAHSVQQAEWDYLLKYKVFGAAGIEFNNQLIRLPDKSGWFGTSHGDFIVEQNGQDTVGGKIIIGGKIFIKQGPLVLTTGPVRADSIVIDQKDNFRGKNNFFGGPQCIGGTIPDVYANFIPDSNRFFNNNCPDSVPEVKTNLYIPKLSTKDTTYLPAIYVNESKYDTIKVPEGEGIYDIYITSINVTNTGKLFVQMPKHGRLTRVFLKDGINLGSAHPRIQILYGDSIINNKDYAGNLLFYTDNDISFESFHNTDTIQGTFISTGTIKIAHHLTLAGQLLANKIIIDTDLDGSGFIFKPFDPPVIDLKPELDEDGGLKENDLTVSIPIALDTPAIVDVFFRYCFDFIGADTSDFNTENLEFPLCNKNEYKEVKINEGEKEPRETILVNVKIDTLTENEFLILHIDSISGAVLPGNQTSGELKIKIVNAEYNGLNFDTTKVYGINENDTGLVDFIAIIGKTDTTKFILDSAVHGIYVLDSITGKLTLTTPLDYESIPVDTVKITLKNGEVTVTRYIPIIINDVNEAPVVRDTTIKINENLATGDTVGKVIATDQDTKPAWNTLSYSILDSTVPFKVDNNGNITVTDGSKINYETNPTFTFNVRVTDNTYSDTATVTIELNDVQENPHIIDDGKDGYDVNENETTGYVIATIKVTDEDARQIFSLSVDVKNTTGADTLLTYTYKVVNDTGNIIISVKDQNKLDYEKINPVQSLNIVVTDPDGKKDSIQKMINVIDVNEAPILDDMTFVLQENLPIPFIVGTMSAIDEDTKADFIKNKYKAVGGDSSLFKVNPTNGVITAIKSFNYESDDTLYVLKVMVYDETDPTLTDTALVIIKIDNKNDRPKITGITGQDSIPENEPPTFIFKVEAMDEDGDSLVYKIIDDVPFTIDQNGNVSSDTTFNYEKDSLYVFKVTVTDENGLSDTITVPVRVTDRPEPVSTKDETFDVNEKDSNVVIGKVTADDEDLGDIIKFTSDDTVHYRVDPTTGEITLLVSFDYETMDSTKCDTLLVFVTDGIFTDTAKVIVKVNDVNEPPTEMHETKPIEENTIDTVAVIHGTDPDISDTVKYFLDDKDTTLFYVDSNGIITNKEEFDYETMDSIYTIMAYVTDGKDTIPVELVIKVDNVDEPVHTKDDTCDIDENITGPSGCKIWAVDDDSTKVKYDVIDSDDYTISEDGEIIINNPPDYETKDKDTITVVVYDDNGHTDTAQVVINIHDVIEDVTITEVDHQPKKDTVKTNNPDHNIDWKICEGNVCVFDSIPVIITKDTTVAACNDNKTVCDSVVFLFNDVPPVVTLVNTKSTDAMIDYITIEEQADGNIYVNKKDNEIKVIVKDTVRKTEMRFNIEVKLDTIPLKPSHIVEYNYLIDEFNETVEKKPIGNNRAEIIEQIMVNGVPVTLTKVVNLETGEPIDSVQTVTYKTKESGKEITVSYQVDNLTGNRISDYMVSYNVDSATTVSYMLDDNKKIVKNEEGNIGYTVKYVYVDDFGNKASSSVEIVFDNTPPKVEILLPIKGDIFKTNAAEVKWTVNGIVQDTLTLQRLEKGMNAIVRRYVDKAGNEAADTVMVIMKEAKDIDISIVYPVTEINQDKVDSFYAEGNKYNPEKPFTVKTLKDDEKPNPVGIGFQIDLALPSVSPTGGLADLGDIVKNGLIPVDDAGNIVGASTKGIPVEQYVEKHCTEEFQKDYHKYGLNIPLYDVTYQLHLWIYTTQANYVNDFQISYELNDADEASDAGTVKIVVDYLAEHDGHVKAFNGHALGTSSYITKLYSKSIARHRCDYKEQVKGDKTVKKDETMAVFGYKRPKK